MALVFYGIPTCDQTRKTQAWLREHGVDHRFHDFRADGLDRAMLERWISHLPWNSLLNRRGTTWRNLPADVRNQVVDQESAIEVMLAHPTLVKRPVIEIGDRLLLGFSAERLTEALRAADAAAPMTRSGQ
ncbi:MAG: ArsC family reductase [Lautropia sp.]